jgi:hypothetical protein
MLTKTANEGYGANAHSELACCTSGGPGMAR